MASSVNRSVTSRLSAVVARVLVVLAVVWAAHRAPALCSLPQLEKRSQPLRCCPVPAIAAADVEVRFVIADDGFGFSVEVNGAVDARIRSMDGGEVPPTSALWLGNDETHYLRKSMKLRARVGVVKT